MKKYSTEEQQRRAKINKRKKMLRMPLTFAEKMFRNIKDFYEDKIKYPIIWFIQRGKRGYCDRDTWDFERWLFYLAPMMIRDIISHIGFDDKYIEKEILEMAICFEKANTIEHFYTTDPGYEEYLQYKYRGLDLLKKYIDYLGW